jgi:hypothetical protein
MESLGWVLVTALLAAPLGSRLLELQRAQEPVLWEQAGRPCVDFWRPGADPERLQTELAALSVLLGWVIWTPSWVEQRAWPLGLLWGLRVLVLSDAVAFLLAL